MNPQEFVRKLWRMNRVFPVALGVMILASLVLFAVNAWILTPEFQLLQRRYIALQEQVRHADSGRQVSMIRRLQADRRNLQTFRETVGDYDEFTDFIGELFDLAGMSGLSIDQVRYKPEGIEEHDLLRYDLSFSVSGDYGEIKKFVFSLEQSRRIIVIEEISLAGGGQAERSSVKLQIMLSTYFATDNG